MRGPVALNGKDRSLILYLFIYAVLWGYPTDVDVVDGLVSNVDKVVLEHL